MSKTENVIKALNEGKDTATIKTETGASEALISKCRNKIKTMQETPEETPEAEPEEEEPTEEELESIIKRIQIKPEEKYLTKDKPEEEEYTCMGCKHVWKSSNIPTSCPNCKAEF
jgi:rubrerythrin